MHAYYCIDTLILEHGVKNLSIAKSKEAIEAYQNTHHLIFELTAIALGTTNLKLTKTFALSDELSCQEPESENGGVK